MQKRRGDLIINVNHELPSIKKHQEKQFILHFLATQSSELLLLQRSM